MERRQNEDDIEVQLRAIDVMENETIEGDNMIVQQFSYKSEIIWRQY
jgi:hypothetical protein